MKTVAPKPEAAEQTRGGEAGSALVFVLLTVCVLSVVAASLLLTNVSRYQTTFQSASWQEAIVGSEAGVDLAMNELRRRVLTGPSAAFQTNWTTTNPQTGQPYANYGHAFPASNQPYPVASHGGEGNTALQLQVFVDVPGSGTGTNFARADDTSFISQVDNPNLRDPDGVDRSRWLFRVKSLGITSLTGPARPNLNKYDNRLRRFSFFNDWRTGRSVGAPQVARLVEAVVRPQTGFRNALMADQSIDLSNKDVLVDSYDSSKGPYSATNQGNEGNIATNGQLINAGQATVKGDAMTNNGKVVDAQNVTGQESSNFYQELPPITAASLNPAWAGVANGGTVTSSQTYVASTDPNNPTLVRLNGINLPNSGQVISLAAPKASGAVTAATPAYIKLYVQGDIATAGSSYVSLDPNVNAIFYVAGSISLQGVGVLNSSYLASHLVLDGLQPAANADGTYPARTLSLATTEDFAGIVYAPNHDLSLALQAVPASGATGSSYLNPNSGLISNLQGQVKNLNDDITNLQKDIQNKQGDDDKNGGDAAGIAQDNARIAADQAQVNTLNLQIAALGGGTMPASSAADHAAGYNGIYGGFVAKTIKVANKTHIHYDETLRTAGPVNHYEIVNWFEDNLSHDAAGGTEAFWWPGTR